MSKYNFKCESCSTIKTVYVTSNVTCDICVCGGNMKRCLPQTQRPQVRETVDKFFNRKWIENQKDILQDRKDVHFWKNEVPRLVNSGTYSIETMLENGWIFFDDKENIQIRTKSPRDN